MQTIDLPAGVTLVEEPLPGIKVDTDLCSALIYFNGAHVAHWQPKSCDQPVLWMSESSIFEQGQPIRGGVPVMYPWFGSGRKGDEQPSHGFARLAQWTLKSATIGARDAIRLVFGLVEVDSLPGADRYPKAEVELHVSVGSVLQQSLVVVAGDEPISFEAGFHSYFAVSDIKQVQVKGLDGAKFTSEVGEPEGVVAGDITFIEQYDRRFESTANTLIVDEGWNRTIHVDKSGSPSTVVWNPWAEKAAAMADFGADEWQHMVCVEAAAIRNDAIHLDAGGRHMLSQVVSVSCGE